MSKEDRVVERCVKVQGWMRQESLRWLYRTAQRFDRCLEVGSWKGRSAIAISSGTPGNLVCVDQWVVETKKSSTVSKLVVLEGTEHVYSTFCSNLSPELESGKVQVVRGDSRDPETASAVLDLGPYDFVFVDGDHTYEMAAHDIKTYGSMVLRGGVVAGHDYDWPTVRKAVLEIFPNVKNVGHDIWYTTI